MPNCPTKFLCQLVLPPTMIPPQPTRMLLFESRAVSVFATTISGHLACLLKCLQWLLVALHNLLPFHLSTSSCSSFPAPCTPAPLIFLLVSQTPSSLPHAFVNLVDFAWKVLSPPLCSPIFYSSFRVRIKC